MSGRMERRRTASRRRRRRAFTGAPRRIRAIAAVAALAALAGGIGTTPARAASIFGVRGPGVSNTVSDARARALGGWGIALGDSLHGNLVNPAMSARVDQVTFGVAATPSITWAVDMQSRARWGDLGFNAAWLYLPVGHRRDLLVAGGLRNERSTRGEVQWSEIDTSSVTGDISVVNRRFRRDGDQFSLPLALVYAGASKRWAIATGVDFLFRSLEEKLSWEFTTTGFPGTTIRTTENVNGAAPAISVALWPNSRASLGLIYRHRATLKGDLEVKQEAGTVSRERTSLRYPARAGAGLSWNTGSLLLVGDVAWEDWSRTNSHSGSAASAASSRVDDTVSWSLGVEAGGHDRRIPVMGRRPFRAGLRRETLPETSFGDGARLHQDMLSIGTGWTLSGGLATLDLSLEAGRRGGFAHQDARERVFQIGISMSGREPWKRPDRHGGYSPEPATPPEGGY